MLQCHSSCCLNKVRKKKQEKTPTHRLARLEPSSVILGDRGSGGLVVSRFPVSTNLVGEKRQNLK